MTVPPTADVNLVAYTAGVHPYPEYLSINARYGRIEITVRPPSELGVCGVPATICMTREQFAEFLKEATARFGTL